MVMICVNTWFYIYHHNINFHGFKTLLFGQGAEIFDTNTDLMLRSIANSWSTAFNRTPMHKNGHLLTTKAGPSAKQEDR